MNTTSKILCGRALALNAAVTMDTNTISNDCSAYNGGTTRSDFRSVGFSGGQLAATLALLGIGLFGIASQWRGKRKT